MRYVKPPVGTVCVGSAYGEAAMLLAAGEKVSGSRSWADCYFEDSSIVR